MMRWWAPNLVSIFVLTTDQSAPKMMKKSVLKMSMQELNSASHFFYIKIGNQYWLLQDGVGIMALYFYVVWSVFISYLQKSIFWI